jgi:hypothetical protein
MTWAADLRRAGTPVFYSQGGYDNPVMSLSKYGGLIGTATRDAKDANTMKLREALKALILRGFEYIFVCDDDTFVHSGRWLQHSYVGNGLECLEYRATTQKDRATGGSGWWMTRELAAAYVSFCTDERSWDDVLIAKVARRIGIALRSLPELYGADKYHGRNDRVSPSNKLMTCHHVEPDEMLMLYKENLCCT